MFFFFLNNFLNVIYRIGLYDLKGGLTGTLGSVKMIDILTFC